jgi:hypothetical protein
VSFHRRYLQLAQEIESNFAVAQWQAGDLALWPLARMDLYMELYGASVGVTPPPARSLLRRALERYATPAVHLWRSRHDLAHWLPHPRKAPAIVLGDGVSLDFIDGAWRDRYGEPLMQALDRRGVETFLMQTGDLSRLPWARRTYAANLVAQRGRRRSRRLTVNAQLPQLDDVVRWLRDRGVGTGAFEQAALQQRARSVLAIADEFEKVLRVVKPRLAFVVTYYAELGPPFLLACRRQGILSVDLQHCPQEGAHKAYGWSAVPAAGYAVLPAVFWQWTAADAAYVAHWTSRLSQPWHRSLHGGHLQLTPFLDDADPATRAMDARFDALSGGARFEREILISLQPVSGYRAQWEALASTIRTAPASWRWWIRRHPAARSYQDEEYRALVQLRLPNVMVEPASQLPLPALLRHMSVLVSRYSGASAEAETFGVPALFLSEEARGQFSAQIERGTARVIGMAQLIAAIEALPSRTQRPRTAPAPQLDDTLARLEQLAPAYRAMCRDSAVASRRKLAESTINCA